MPYICCLELNGTVLYVCTYECNGKQVELTADTEEDLIGLISNFLNRPEVLDDTQVTSSFLTIV